MKIGLYKIITPKQGVPHYGIAHDIKDVPFILKFPHYPPATTAAERDRAFCRLVNECWAKIDQAMKDNPKLKIYGQVSSGDAFVVRLRYERRNGKRR